jgi:hypothetical protein
MMFGHLFQLLTKLLVVLTPNTKTGQLMSQHILVSIAFLEEDAHQNARKVTFHVKLDHMSHDDICCVFDP